MSLPIVTLTGGVVLDPELRVTDQGKMWTRLRVGCQDRVRDGQGGWVNGETTYLTVTVFGRPAENLLESICKGDQIMVTGRLQMREYEVDGIKRVDYGVIADEIGVSTTFHPAKTPRSTEQTQPTAVELPPF